MLLNSGGDNFCSHEVLRRASPGGARPAQCSAEIWLISKNLIAPGKKCMICSWIVVLLSGAAMLRRASAGGARPAQRSAAAARNTCLMPRTLVAGVFLARIA